MLKEPILYVDNHLLVLNKSIGLLTQPNETNHPSLEVWGKGWIKEHFQRPGNVFLEAVHRLDRPASGVVLFARTDKALSRLNRFSRAGQFQKCYFILVEGRVVAKEGTLTHFLLRDEYRSQVVSKDHPDGKLCVLKYQTVESLKEHTLLKINLITGRYHQIRAQFAAIGHPIWGDKKYGSKKSLDHIFLHHASLSFPHPIHQNSVTIKAPLPDFWNSTVNSVFEKVAF